MPSSIVPRHVFGGVLAEMLIGARRLAHGPDRPGSSSMNVPAISSATCSSRRRRWLGNNPSGLNSIINTSAPPKRRYW